MGSPLAAKRCVAQSPVGVSMASADDAELRVSLKELPDAMDRAVYVLERFPLVVDASGQATRFLKYQRGSVLMAGSPADMAPESLRRHLVDAIKHGVLLVINFDVLISLELDQFFAPDTFPEEVLSRQQLFSPAVLERILRPAKGEPDVNDFVVNDHFKLVVLYRASPPPPRTAEKMCVIHVHLPDGDGQAEQSNGNDGLAKALGVSKETKRNSIELVEAAFDNDMDTVVSCLDKNYDLESEDGHAHTALSEAASQGNDDIVKLLLERGADPNKCNDENRSPLYRASYNGHLGTVKLLLESGADPRLKTKQGEPPFDVAKTKEIQDVISQWDLLKTDRFVEERRKVIEAKWQERITNHLEREQLALQKIHSELLELARKGDLPEITTQLEQLADEVVDSGERPRACAGIRDERGSTLVALAAQFDHVDLVTALLTKWKELEQQAREIAVSSSSAAQQQTAKRLQVLANVWKTNVNARDCRGWTPVAIAVFHESKKSLRVLLDNGADPGLKNQYNKDAYYFAKDDLDAAHNIVKSRAEVRSRACCSLYDE
jgi:ankyrin repeat protein